MTEEQITKSIINWLQINDWKIICFDFPQSGTGVSLHPNNEIRTTKNKGAIIPDIVSIKGTVVLFFENKDRFVLSDFVKVSDLKNGTDYSESTSRLLKGYNVTKIYYGVGLPDNQRIKKSISIHENKIDFALLVEIDKSVNLYYCCESFFV